MKCYYLGRMWTWRLLSRDFLSNPFLRIQICQWTCLDKCGCQMTWGHLVKDGDTLGELSLHHMHCSASLLFADHFTSGSLGLGLTRDSRGSISKRFLCCWNCICNPVFSNCFLVRSDLSDFTRLYTLSKATLVFFSSLVCRIRSLQTLTGCITRLQY